MEEFDLKRFAKLAMAKKAIIIVIMILAIVAGAFYSYVFVVPKYKSKTTLLVAQIKEDVATDENTIKQSEITDLSMTKTLLQPYISLVESNKVIKKVIDNLHVNMTEDQLKKMVSVAEENEAMISITVVSENAEFAAKVANEIADVFVEESHEIFNITNVKIIDVAEVKETPYNVNHIKDIVVFGLLGAFASCGLILLIYMLDTTIKEEEDIEQELKLPVLGVIPEYTRKLEENDEKDEPEETTPGRRRTSSKSGKKTKKRKHSEIVILGNTKSPVSEAFRALRTNLTFSPNTKTILVTSCGMSEGKSYVTANLGTAIAKAGKKIIIVDADMRKGRQNKIFELDNKKGLSNYLANCEEEGKSEVEEISTYIKTTGIPNLHIITSGSRPSNPAELLEPHKIQGLLSVLEDIYDIVLIDGTPSSIIADSVALAKFVDYAMLVTSHKTTKLEEAKKIIKNFEQVGGRIKGAVLNKYPLTKEEYSSSYYYADEKSVPRLEETTTGEIKSVQEFLDEANVRKSSLKAKERKKLSLEMPSSPDFSSASTSASTSVSAPVNTQNNPAAVSSALEFKIEKIDNELAAMKNVLMQIAINSGQITSKDIEVIRYDIKTLKDAMEGIRDNSKIEELKKEVESTKDLAESLVKSQEENSEKIKKFIENYYRNKSKKEGKN